MFIVGCINGCQRFKSNLLPSPGCVCGICGSTQFRSTTLNGEDIGDARMRVPELPDASNPKIVRTDGEKIAAAILDLASAVRRR